MGSSRWLSLFLMSCGVCSFVAFFVICSMRLDFLRSDTVCADEEAIIEELALPLLGCVDPEPKPDDSLLLHALLVALVSSGLQLGIIVMLMSCIGAVLPDLTLTERGRVARTALWAYILSSVPSGYIARFICSVFEVTVCMPRKQRSSFLLYAFLGSVTILPLVSTSGMLLAFVTSVSAKGLAIAPLGAQA